MQTRSSTNTRNAVSLYALEQRQSEREFIDRVSPSSSLPFFICLAIRPRLVEKEEIRHFTGDPRIKTAWSRVSAAVDSRCHLRHHWKMGQRKFIRTHLPSFACLRVININHDKPEPSEITINLVQFCRQLLRTVKYRIK